MSYYPSPYPYPYGPFPPPAPLLPAPVTSEEGPATTPPRGLWPTRFAFIFGTVLTLLTVITLGLAAFAPAFVGSASDAIPSQWNKAYDGVPEPDQWHQASGCQFQQSGLRIDGAAQIHECYFIPSFTTGYVAQGIYVAAQVAPAAYVAGNEEAALLIGDGSTYLRADVDQSGSFRLCVNPCSLTSDALAEGGYISGDTVAWHFNGYTPNTVGLRYLAATQTATLYVNGQEVRSISFAAPPNALFALGTTSSTEVLFTHVIVYAARA